MSESSNEQYRKSNHEMSSEAVSVESSSRRDSYEDENVVILGNMNMLSSSPFSIMMSSEDESMASSGPSSPSSLASSVSSSASEQAKRRRRKKKRLAESMSTTSFKDIYYLTGDVLGEGSYGRVETCINMYTNTEYAVKIISKRNWCFSRSKVLKEIELYYLCQGQKEIIQLIEYFEEAEYFYLIFEKAYGGPLLNQIQKRVHFSEEEAVTIIRDLALALRFLHERGIAHRDLKPENILCVDANAPYPIKLCDFDLCSSVNQTLSTPLLQSPVGSAEYMAPEVVNAFSVMSSYDDDEDELTYDKKCDLWSLGIIAYILLCGYLPFSGHCDTDCGWDRGEECLQCQRSLFDAIKSGALSFPEQHWSNISAEAKDLISRLLVKEASQRLDSNGVLQHPWIVNGGSKSNALETPAVLRRQTSVKEISDLAFNVISAKRNCDLPTTPMISYSRKMRMPRSATTNDLENNNHHNHEDRKKLPVRKTSAMVFSDQLTSASVNGRKTSLGNMMTRRQTSLIFPERIDSLYNRCEY